LPIRKFKELADLLTGKIEIQTVKMLALLA
jgi:hypothetical protein